CFRGLNQSIAVGRYAHTIDNGASHYRCTQPDTSDISVEVSLRIDAGMRRQCGQGLNGSR
ncbi:MAG: hypothetical protein OEU33_16565, partial [Chromatiales bacterium]|nr:hypothetical protein [Chromatiales bacterium]